MIPENIIQKVEQQLVYQSEYMGRLSRIKDAIQRLGISDFNDNGAYFTFDQYSEQPKVIITAYDQSTFDLFKTGIEKGMGEKAEWTQTFDDRFAEFSYTTVDFDVHFILKIGAKPCQVEVLEEEVSVPARTEKVKKFVLKGDCNEPEPAPAAEPDIMTKLAVAAGALPAEG